MKSYLTICTSVLMLAGCSAKIDDTHMNGQELFSAYCAGCHKEAGTGSFLKGIPANRNTLLSKQQITDLILGHTSDDRKMPSFAHLSRQQADSIAVYIKTRL